MDNSQKKNQCIHWQWQSEKRVDLANKLALEGYGVESLGSFKKYVGGGGLY